MISIFVSRPLARALRFSILTFPMLACDSALDTRNRDVTSARVVVSGTSAVPLTLVTSTDFQAFRVINTGEIVVEITSADTASISVPIDRTFAFNGANRFFVKLINPDTAVTVSIRLRLLVDGREVFDESANMRDASLQYTFLNFSF